MVVIHKRHEESAVEREERIKNEQGLAIEDQYQVQGNILFSWIEKHKALSSAMVLFLLLIGAAIVSWCYYTGLNNEKASAIYFLATKDINELDRNKKEDEAKLVEAKAKLLILFDKYPNTKVSILAKLSLANEALATDNIEEAIRYYQEANKQLAPDNHLYAISLIGLGYAQEKNNDKVSALSSFEQVVNNNKLESGVELALWEAARLAKDNNEQEKAKKYVMRLLDEYPSTIYEKNAKKLNAGLLP